MVARGEILLVDDEEGVRQSWQRFLSGIGHSVRTAADGDKAIQHLAQHPVDLVISDLRMPGPDGLEVLQWIRERSKPINFILLTGYGTRDVEARARSLGAYEYVEKPVAPELLAAMVASALTETPLPAAAPPKLAVEPVPEPRPKAAPAKPERRSLFRILALLAAAPIMGLAFVVFLPVIGFALFGYLIGSRALQLVRPAR